MFDYDYTICTEPDEDIFKRQCAALEKHIPLLKKEPLMTDVDNTKIQIYFKDGKKIKVKNDYMVGAVYIQSEIELTQFFKDK